MKSQNYKQGQRAFFDSLSSALEKVAESSPDRKYNVAFGLNLDAPYMDQSSSEVLSLLSAFTRIINQFGDGVPLTVLVDIVESNNISEQIAKHTKESYETKAKLAKGVPEATKAVAESAIVAQTVVEPKAS